MGKRSEFERRKNDAYGTPAKAVVPLLPHMTGIRTFAASAWYRFHSQHVGGTRFILQDMARAA